MPAVPPKSPGSTLGCSSACLSCAPFALQITVATNLAGRGTDILLGGNPKGLVLQLLENKLLDTMAAGELLQYFKPS
jgi:hypothetical protein